jgi:hypothetical protein
MQCSRDAAFPANAIPCDQAKHRPYKTTYSPFVLKTDLQRNKAKYQLHLFLLFPNATCCNNRPKSVIPQLLMDTEEEKGASL